MVASDWLSASEQEMMRDVYAQYGLNPDIIADNRSDTIDRMGRAWRGQALESVTDVIRGQAIAGY
jgi:hypothetical protein